MKRMNKRLTFLIVTILFSVILTACSGENGDDDNKSSQTTQLNFPTGATSGTIYPLGSAMANLWTEEIDGVRVNVQASNGGVDNLNLLQQGEAQISFATTGIVWEAFNGERSFEGRPYEDLRIVAGLYMNPNQFVVHKDAGIDSIADLAGKNFAPGTTGSTPEVESSIILPEYGIEYPDGINANFVGFTEAIDLMRNKQIDGALIQAGLPTAAVTEMISTADGKLIGIEDDVREKLMDEYPWYADFTIPAGTYDGQDEDVDTLAIKMVLFTDASIDEDTIYELTKTFWENLDQLKDSHAIVEQMDIEEATTDLADVPLHDGAIRYYEEVGVMKE